MKSKVELTPADFIATLFVGLMMTINWPLFRMGVGLLLMVVALYLREATK